MQKLFYFLFDDEKADGGRLRDAIRESAVPAMREAGATGIVVFANDDDVAQGECVRLHDPPIRAAVSFWLEDAADRPAAEEALRALVPDLAGYLVLESRPMVHDRPRGGRTPGMKQITCIRKRADLEQDEFIRIWHGDHRKVAIETQSTFGYVRNEIIRVLTPESGEPWSAIVEESFPIEALSDPMVFFDARTPEEHQANVERMMESCARFLEMDRIEVTFVSEYDLG